MKMYPVEATVAEDSWDFSTRVHTSIFSESEDMEFLRKKAVTSICDMQICPASCVSNLKIGNPIEV